jgi:hypothetical protein
MESQRQYNKERHHPRRAGQDSTTISMVVPPHPPRQYSYVIRLGTTLSRVTGLHIVVSGSRTRGGGYIEAKGQGFEIDRCILENAGGRNTRVLVVCGPDPVHPTGVVHACTMIGGKMLVIANGPRAWSEASTVGNPNQKASFISRRILG